MEEHTKHTYFKIDMAGCRNFDEMMNMISRNLPLIGDFDRFYLCLTGIHDINGIPSFQKEVPAEAEAVLRWENGALQKTQSDPFPRQELLPKGAEENKPVSYYFTMLHDRASTFGYTAVSFRHPEDGIGIFYFDWNLTIALTINEYFAHQRIQALMQRNEKNSITDYLTQMNNRRGLARALKKNWPVWVTTRTEIAFISVDLDGLKFINDHYGHEEGDRAICVISRTIQRMAPRGTIMARTGGDEFLILLAGGKDRASQFETQITQELDALNRSNKGHFVVEASIGCYVKTIDESVSFQECMRQSDNEMYEKKHIRKKERRS
jgi:diguanylate cyclase (GGDEF)-like protein